MSDGYWHATTDTEKNNFVAAAEAVFASDLWNGTGARLSGILIQSGALVMSVIMLNSESFTN